MKANLGTVNFYFRVEKKNIAAIKFILEAYEVLGPVSTMDRKAAIIRISPTPDFAGLLLLVMDDLKRKYKIEEQPAWNSH